MKALQRLVCLLPVLVVASSAVAQLPRVPTPRGNLTTPSKVNLGKVLFFDEQMSSTRTVACATCHIPGAAGTDPRAGSVVNPGPDGQYGTPDDIHSSPGVPLNNADGTYSPSPVFGLGVQMTGRTAPMVINAAYNFEQFWDGRATSVFDDPITGVTILPTLASLEAQASGPPTSNAEMAHGGRDWNDVASRMASSEPLALATNIPAVLDAWIGQRSYPDLFNEVWGDPAVTPARIIMAIAAYERTQISNQTPFDLQTLTPQQQSGLAIFRGKARCEVCHHGILFRDNQYHNTGLRPVDEDLGRFDVTGIEADKGRFRTPGMRNVGLRTSFFHTGGLLTLEEVVDFYDRGGDFTENLDPEMQPLGLLAQEKADLIEFIRNGLLDWRVAGEFPPFDRPTLYSETNRVPASYGNGAPGTDGAVPRLMVVEPPVLGNPNLTFALDNGLGNTLGVLGLAGLQGTGQPVLGVPFHLGGPVVVFLPIALQGSGGGQGYWSQPLRVPNQAASNGTSLFIQAFVVDGQGAQGFSASNGVQMTFFAAR